MKPSEVRERVLADHAELRDMLDRLEAPVQRVVDGEEALVGALREGGQALLARLREHMGWEDRYLAPALRAADAWGEERAARLDADHREQRELLTLALERLRDEGRPPTLVARDLASLIQLLRDDMRDEEHILLDARVLRDDVIGIDVETG